MNPVADDPVDRLRTLCLAYPAVSERLSHGEPTWFVQGKRVLAQLDDHHHGTDHLAFSCVAPEGVQGLLVEADEDQYFRPPYVGAKGWIGVRIDRNPDWDHIRTSAGRRCPVGRQVGIWPAPQAPQAKYRAVLVWSARLPARLLSLLLDDAFRLVAPKRLVTLWEAQH